MPKVRGPLFSENASGKLGKSLTYQKRGGTNVVYLFSKPGINNPLKVSQKQQDQRTYYFEGTQKWEELTPEQKIEYIQKGWSLNLTGFNYFMRLWLNGEIPVGPEIVFELTVQSGKVSGSHEDFPLYVDLAEAPASFWEKVKNGGGDIRVFENEELTEEIPREVVSCDNETKKGELWAKIGALGSSSKIYIQADGESEAYANTDTYGRNNVWSDFIGVYHLNGDSKDSTEHGKDGVDTNIDYGADYGKIEKGALFNASTDRITCGHEAVSLITFSFSGWVRMDSLAERGIMGKGVEATDSMHGFLYTGSSNATPPYGFTFGFTTNGRWATNTLIRANETPEIDKWYYVVGTYDKQKLRLYINGSFNVEKNETNSARNSTGSLYLGNFYDNNYALRGDLDEARVISKTLSGDWIATEYQNQNDNNAFWGIWKKIK